MLVIKDWDVNKIYHFIDGDHVKGGGGYAYIILGRAGRTGKTWLCNALKQSGFKAFEITESIYNLVSYDDQRNHFVIDDLNKQVIIVLNRPL